MATEIGGVEIKFGHPKQPKALPLTHPKARWDAKQHGTASIVLKKGHVRRRGCLPLPCDIQLDRDVSVVLRDGCKIFVDVYRPVDTNFKVPGILAWSPYGKQGGLGNQVLDDFPFRFGVPLKTLSEFQKWEGPDPGYWVQHGYAIINPDPRGVGMSEGNIYQFGTQEGRDEADVIEWIGSQDWCSGKVSMSGNSYLAISQWFIAAEKPKYLAAIAPWEGFADTFREFGLRGGVPTKPALNFALQIAQVNAGNNSWENPISTTLDKMTYGPYHKDKEAKVENIDVPAYVVASWSNPVHVYGTFRAYCRLRTEKWLRIHDTIEWPDYYCEEWRTDLHRFFDWSLKGQDNGWQTTPKVRAKIIDTAQPYANSGKLITLSAFPPTETKPLKLFFNGNKTLTTEMSSKTELQYRAANQEITFDYRFEKDTVLCGMIDVHLNVSTIGTKDSNVFVNMEKILNSGSVGKQLIIPFEHRGQSIAVRVVHATKLVPMTNAAFYKGPKGQIRIGQRLEDTEISIPGLPVQRMDIRSEVEQGQLIHLKVGMTPIGMNFRTGEKLRIKVGGIDHSAFPPVDQATLTVDDMPELFNDGSVVLHCCQEVDGKFSSVTLPVL